MKNTILAAGAVAAAGVAIIGFGDQLRERCESLGWGWCTASNGDDEPAVARDTAQAVDETAPHPTSIPNLPLPELTPIPPEDVPLPATFTRGCATGDPDERPPREVTINRRLYMSQAPITFEQYAVFAREAGRDVPSPTDFPWDTIDMTLPVLRVSWQDAVDYADWLGEQTGSSCRLPSEAEWEFACRAGQGKEYPWGDDFDPQKANTSDAGPGQPTAADTYPANPWGLYDMSGNVWEWVLDHYHNTYDGAPIDGSARIDDGDQDNSPRVLRGGSWGSDRHSARCASRGHSGPISRDNNFGFRVVCSSPS